MTAFFVHCAGPTEWYFGEWDLGGRGGLLLLCVTELWPRTEDRILQLISFILEKHPHMLQTAWQVLASPPGIPVILGRDHARPTPELFMLL